MNNTNIYRLPRPVDPTPPPRGAQQRRRDAPTPITGTQRPRLATLERASTPTLGTQRPMDDSTPPLDLIPPPREANANIDHLAAQKQLPLIHLFRQQLFIFEAFKYQEQKAATILSIPVPLDVPTEVLDVFLKSVFRSPSVSPTKEI